MSSRLGIVLFGASGFTGTYCIESLHKLTKPYKFTWGIAGRSEQKLREVLREYENKIGEDLSSVPIIIADVNNFESLKKMTAQARMIINCCGPFRLYGEPVIKACLETGTHQVDVTGEPLYMETIKYKYTKAAEEKGIYIVSACGFDSIPADLGVLFLQDKFDGTVNSVESYLELLADDIKKINLNYGTYESAVYGLAAKNELRQLRRKLYPTRLPKFKPKLEPRSLIHKSNLINKWCIPFPVADRSVIQRTQRYFFNNNNTRPVQIQTYIGLESFRSVVYIVVLGLIFSLFARYKWGRSLLLKYPAVFTAGLVKEEPPSKLALSTAKFEMTLDAEGWNEKLTEAIDEFKIPPNKRMVVRLSGVNPGYTLTANLVTLAAIMILTDVDKLPKTGGVYTPGVAFRRTPLIEMLQKNGLKIELL